MNLCEIIKRQTSIKERVKVINENQVGVFDNFFIPFLNYFQEIIEEELSRITHKSKIQVNFKNILMSALISLKEDLMLISMKTLITELYERKSDNLLIGSDSSERYNYFNDSFLSTQNIIDLLLKYPVLEYLIESKIHTKIGFIIEAFKRLVYDFKNICDSFVIGFNNLEDIILSSGDTHNNGKSVMIFLFKEGKLVYKPHSLAPENMFNRILSWINSKDILATKMKNTLIIDNYKYGWQEFIEHDTCNNIKEVNYYFYKIGVVLCIFYILKCEDLHSENIIAYKDNPILIDLETLLTNEKPYKVNENLLSYFGSDIHNSVLGTMLLPIDMVFSMFDVDISGLSGQGGQKSQKLDVYRLINNGTDEIRLVKDFFITSSNNNNITLNGNKMDIADFYEEILSGFSDCYNLVLGDKYGFIDNIKYFLDYHGRFRQIFRPTRIYYRYIEAANHPKYLKDFEERKRLLSKLFSTTNKNTSKDQKRIEAEVYSLFRNDIPYFCADITTSTLYANETEIIDGFFDKNLYTLLLESIKKLNSDDLKKQMLFIKMSIMTAKKNVWEKGHQVIKTSKKLRHKLVGNTKSYLECAKEIGNYFFNNAVWNKGRDKCTMVSLVLADNEKLQFGPLNFSLYEGGGAVLFLYALAKETNDNRYINIAKAYLLGIEETWVPFFVSEKSISAFSGLGALVYLYYNISILSGDIEIGKKYKHYLEELSNYQLTAETGLDIIGGVSGVIIVCLNIFKTNNDSMLLNIAEKLGEFLYNRLINEDVDHLNGFSHGYSGYALSLIMLGTIISKQKYIALGRELVEKENSNFNVDKNNWRDLRSKGNNGDPVFWCHGAPGIGMARAIMLQYVSDEDKEFLFTDLNRSINKLFLAGFNAEIDHSLCHGAFGNIDILIKISILLGDEKLMSIVHEKALWLTSDICENGIRYGLESICELTGFMLGMSGIGYTMLRLVNPKYPSVLALDVINKEGIFNENNK